MKIEYENRIVVFIDILGFVSLIKESEKDKDILVKLFGALNYLKTSENPEGWNTKTIKIEEDAQKKGINSFRIDEKTNITCFSDSIIVSVSLQDIGINEAVSTLVANLS